MKKNFALLVLLSLFIGLSATAQIPTNGLVGYWMFNGNANDASGNNVNGTVNGATLTSDRFGNANNAYSFNGVNSYINLGNNTNLNFSLNDDITFSSWLKTGSILEQRIYSKRAPSADAGIELVLSEDTVYIFYGGSSGNYVWNKCGTKGYADNKWHHLLIRINQQSKAIDMYIDNVYQNIVVNTSTVTSAINTTNNAYIGADANHTTCFNGLIDDFRIYKRVLNSSEISELYYEGICQKAITVTDTLVINANLTGYNPITYQNKIKIYPNPTFDHITIDCGSNYNTMNSYTIMITNSLSQTVYTSIINKKASSIDLNGWSGKGIYFIHLIDGNSNTIDIRKIVLQ